MKKVTIKEVADAAGVSVATVDRVLNKRPGVRAATVTKVMNTIEELRYAPSQLAAQTKGKVRIAFVLPDNRNTFMGLLNQAIEELDDWPELPNVTIRTVHTQVFDGEILAKTLEELKGTVEGVAVVALDHPAVKEAINDLVANGIKVVTIISDLPTSDRSYYVGQDNSSAGRTAASLMGKFVGAKRGSIGLLAGSLSLRDHAERQMGFEQVLSREYPQFRVLPIRESQDNFVNVEKLTLSLIENNPDLVGIYNVGAGNRGIVNALQGTGSNKKIVFIAHEITPFTRKALINHSIDALINQDYQREARSAAKILWALTCNEKITEDEEKIRTEIILQHNLP